ncbi:hypothetical protein [Clostridium carboxidivorans]|uniref:hypothetical protein n=1 Tax=Clostridium carboxidivorans TaxID=217159 RepID=UPI000AF94DB0|nr:hypothetical protein [Clostridium carboxidivorans]
MNMALKTLIESINSQIEVLVKNGYEIHDSDNLEYFLGSIKYDSRDDLIKANFMEKE